MKRILAFLLFASFAVAAQAQTAAITVWPNGVPPQGLTHKENFGDHVLSISHREKSGRAEVHLKKADVMIIQSGTATLISGGTVVDPVTTAPNELQGSSITGGVSRTVQPGDVIEVPMGLPHQFLLAPGTQITYLLVKIVRN